MWMTAPNGTEVSRKALVMNANSGYQLYQAERNMSRAEVLSMDAQRGRQMAAITRGGPGLAHAARASAVIAVNAIIAIAAGPPPAPADPAAQPGDVAEDRAERGRPHHDRPAMTQLARIPAVRHGRAIL